MSDITMDRRHQLDLRAVVEVLLWDGATIVDRVDMIIQLTPRRRVQLIMMPSNQVVAIDVQAHHIRGPWHD